MTHPDSTALDRDEAARLLPWLVTDRLPAPELHRLLDHLKTDAELRGELRFLSELARAVDAGDEEATTGADAATERGLERVLARIDAAERGRGWAARRLPGRRLATVAAATLAIAVGIVAGSGRDAVPAVFQTLSEGALPATPAAGPRIRLVFDPATPEAELRAVLAAAGAALVGGPSATGVYTAELPATARLDDAIATLRSSPRVLLAEPAAGG